MFEILSDKSAVQAAAAKRVLAAAQSAIAQRGRFSFVLSGGSTPGGLFELLAQAPYRDEIDWSKVYVFWGDERYVLLDHPDSCYLLAYETLLSKVEIPFDNILPFATHLEDPAEAAQRYSDDLRAFFGDQEPRFDLVLLGMGPDGHTASLFPGHSSLQADPNTWVIVEPDSPKPPPLRLSLTLPLFNQAREVLFLVTGSDKADALAEIKRGGSSLPAALVQPKQGELVWLVDQAAASKFNAS
jgi:6-phosphogluconolactonase